MAGRESFAVLSNSVLIMGLTIVFYLHQKATMEQCANLAWGLLFPSSLYYTHITFYFVKHEQVYHCEPPASKKSCFMIICGCTLLFAIALLHTRIAYKEIYAMKGVLVVHQAVIRIAATAIAWTCFIASLGYVEYEKLAYVSEKEQNNFLCPINYLNENTCRRLFEKV